MSKKIQYNKPVSVLKLGRGQSRKKLGLYFHIPFCLKKCSYCDFYSVSMNRAKMKEYISAMIQQMTYYRAAASTYQVDTLYLGGGTPSLR